MKPELSIVIPVGPDDSLWHDLLSDLVAIPASFEIILVGTAPLDAPNEAAFNARAARGNVHWAVTARGRGKQLNHGARFAKGAFLWFLHADSRVSQAALSALEDALREKPDALHYFDIRFQGKTRLLTKLNELGTRIRSRVFGLPFGDQGLCVACEVYNELGGFREDVLRGEDHFFVWAAHHAGIPLHRVGHSITTSARGYDRNGWLRTTSKNLVLTLSQAVPQFGKMLVTWLRRDRVRVTR